MEREQELKKLINVLHRTARTAARVQWMNAGENEARFAAEGVLAGTPGVDGVVGDLGGSSLELARLAEPYWNWRTNSGESHLEIAENIYYLVQGKPLSEERPKKDVTSAMRVDIEGSDDR